MDELAVLGLTVAFLVGSLATGASSLEGWICLGLLGVVLPVALLFLLGKAPTFKPWLWGLFVVVAVGAYFYTEWRTPQPSPTDIARQAPVLGAAIEGRVLDTPRLTRSGKARFTLVAQTLIKGKNSPPVPVEGKLYTTTSVNMATGIRPGQIVEIRGNLYKPSPPKNPNQFDFRAYLQRNGMFAGLAGRNLEIKSPPPWGVWQIRDRMTKSHVMGAGMPAGALLSSLVLGSRAVDLPVQVKDEFVRVGLAHALAASGFHVSMVLAFVLILFQNVAPRPKFIIGTTALLGYLTLTGISPSVLRAVVMGIGLLVGELLDRKGRPVTGLALAAVLLLLVNPLWIWDLGFQFSFLATLGLQVSVNAICQRTLAGLPPLLATSIAVPQAAFIWTLPLQLYAIGGFSAYSIVANIICSPLFIVLILGGIVSGILGVIFIPAGAVLAWFVKPLALLVMAIVTTIGNLPGNFRNTGTIELWQLTIAYGLILLVWLYPWWQRQQEIQGFKFPRWLIAGAVVTAALFLPQTLERSRLLQATILESGRAPVMLIQSKGKNILVNTGNRSQANFNLVNFFQKQGISRLDWGIATQTLPDVSEGWGTLLASGVKIDNFADAKDLSISQIYQQFTSDLTKAGTTPRSLEPGETIEIDSNVRIEVIQSPPPALVLTIGDTRWLFLGNMNPKQQRVLLGQGEKIKAETLWWSGGEILPDLVKAAGVQTAVASIPELPAKVRTELEKLGIRVLVTGKEGAIGWRPDSEVQPLSELDDNSTAL